MSAASRGHAGPSPKCSECNRRVGRTLFLGRLLCYICRERLAKKTP